jgi:hypothetical protein
MERVRRVSEQDHVPWLKRTEGAGSGDGEQEAGVAMEPVFEREGVLGTARVLVPTPSSVTG